jgi:X-Pro dipeptidyl-peptidase
MRQPFRTDLNPGGVARARVAFVIALGLAAVVGPPAAAQTTAPPDIVVEDGMTQPVFSFADAIEERVYVETEVDSDNDGALDRVAIDISRPRETDTAGFKVPVIFEHSPYREDVWFDVPYPSVLVDELPQSRLVRPSSAAATAGAGAAAGPGARRPIPDLPGTLDDYYVPRGYAVVLGQSVGTGSSDGCPTSGDMVETLGTKAVIDWLNGRAKGFDEAGEPVTADWTTGDVGMTGVSYNGTLPNMVATTGVEGLKTIIPVAAISSWYDYYRANGLVVAPGTYQGEDTDILAQFTAGQERALGECADEIAELTERQDRVSGDYTRFWRDRDYVIRAHKVEASVMVVHGLNDWNVKTKHFAQWWEQLARHRVPRKIWLHQGGHGGPGNTASVTLPDGRTWTYRQVQNRWFDHWLWDVDNGIMNEPRAIVQREDSSYTTYRDWPDPAARDVDLDLGADNATDPGTLTTDGRRRRHVEQSFVDEGRTIPPTALVANPDTANPNRLVYRSPVLEQAVRVSGTPEMRLRLSVDNRPAANLTVYVVDYGPPGSTAEPFVVTRGWMDPQNRFGPARTIPFRQGKAYDFRWTLEPKDYIFPAGHRIGVVVMSSDQEYTLLPLGGTQLTVTPAASELTLPIVGGRRALDW